jgi:hypothetical protein
MKKLFLFTALLCTLTLSLSADLLNGPYSPESQELVKLAQNSTMPIPGKFNSQEKAIIEKFRRINSTACTELSFIYDDNFMQAMKSNQIFLEAFIQLLLSKNQKFCILKITDYAEKIGNNELFISCIKNMPDEAASTYFTSTLRQLRKNIDCFRSIEIQTRTEAECKEKRDKLKKTINQLITHHKNLISVLNDFAEQAIIEASWHFISPFTEDYFDFLLSLGLNLNSPKIDRLEKPKATYVTMLDILKNNLNKLDPAADYSRTTVQNTINYLLSKGAKTYAELTA